MSQLPAALRRPQKNTPLDLWSMYLVDLGDGTAGNQLFHHQTMMEQRGNSCSITRQCWNSGKAAVPSPSKTNSKSMRLLLELIPPYAHLATISVRKPATDRVEAKLHDARCGGHVSHPSRCFWTIITLSGEIIILQIPTSW